MSQESKSSSSSLTTVIRVLPVICVWCFLLLHLEWSFISQQVSSPPVIPLLIPLENLVYILPLFLAPSTSISMAVFTPFSSHIQSRDSHVSIAFPLMFATLHFNFIFPVLFLRHNVVIIPTPESNSRALLLRKYASLSDYFPLLFSLVYQMVFFLKCFVLSWQNAQTRDNCSQHQCF